MKKKKHKPMTNGPMLPSSSTSITPKLYTSRAWDRTPAGSPRSTSGAAYARVRIWGTEAVQGTEDVTSRMRRKEGKKEKQRTSRIWILSDPLLSHSNGSTQVTDLDVLT